MSPASSTLTRCFLIFLLSVQGPLVLAWDSVGHRLSAAVALEFVETETIDELLRILQAHPRYQQDFLEQMPDYVDQSSTIALAQWLLGQAAYWPDIARGLPDSERQKYNRPSWHYTDGAWVRDSSPFQGNVYVGIEPFTDIDGPGGESIRTEQQVNNVVTGIDYNAAVLTDANAPMAERAVALCWVLHLIGDIHQPLHTGSLFSATLFERGDRGGNAIPIGESNLHSRWDRALAEGGVAAELPLLIERVSGFSQPLIKGVESDWTAWMNESRGNLRSIVYTEAMRQAIVTADSNGSKLGSQTLDAAYVTQMQNVSRQRLGLAGLRLAIFFENELP
jgi:hypothetical protein